MNNALQIGFQIFGFKRVNVVGDECQQGQNRKTVVDLLHKALVFTQIVKQRKQPEKQVIENCCSKQQLFITANIVFAIKILIAQKTERVLFQIEINVLNASLNSIWQNPCIGKTHQQNPQFYERRFRHFCSKKERYL